MTRQRDEILPGVLDNEYGMSRRDLEVARETVQPRSECPHCNPPDHASHTHAPTTRGES